MANKPMKTIKLPGLEDTYTFLQNDATLTVSGKAADAKVTGDALTAVQARIDSVQAGQELGAEQLLATTGTVNLTPYTYRANMSGSDRVTISQITGGTLAFNQLVDAATTSVTVASGHKYVALVGGTWSVGTSDGTALTVTGGADMVFDLTKMFGSAVADYIYGIETATAGAGVALFRTMFPESYYPYNAGELVSVQTSGRVSGGHTYPLDSTLTLRGVPVLTDGKVAYDGDQYLPTGTVARRYGIVDLGTLTWNAAAASGRVKSTSRPTNIKCTSNRNDIIVNLCLCSKAYVLLPFYITGTSDREAYGVDKSIAIVGNESGIVFVHDTSLASKSAAEVKVAMSGVYLVYELATPTTETAAPYQEIQIAGSTEEFLPPATDTRPAAVPVGFVSLYQTNLRDGLEKVLTSISSSGLEYPYPFLKDDKTLTVDGAAADAKVTGDRLTDLGTQVTALSNYVSSEGVYPFTADSTLRRPGYPNQIVYSKKLNGIVDLIVYADDLDTYFVKTLYAYHVSEQKSIISIANSTGRIGTYSAVRSSSTDRPTETIMINDTNGRLLAKATIDWSRINDANGLGLTVESTRIAEGCIIRRVNTDNIRALPITDYYVTNVQQRIYFDEIFRGYNGGYFVVTATGATYPEITYTDRYVQFAFTSTKDATVTIVYRNDDSIKISKTITVHCNVSAIPAAKYMFIGDSYTEAGAMQNWFYDQNSGLVTLYGTRGTAPYLHEGRNGWSVQDYFSAEKGGITNPFYNPSTQTFDFSYYMTNHPEFADVDVVNILLGRNNGFSTTIIAQMQQIVTSIHDYNANIKIFVMVGSNVAANNTGAGRYMQSNERMNLSCFDYNCIVAYENATIIWQNCNLDDVYDFATEQVQATLTNPTLVTMYMNNVHPNLYGYQSFGVVFNGYMHNLLND